MVDSLGLRPESRQPAGTIAGVDSQAASFWNAAKC